MTWASFATHPNESVRAAVALLVRARLPAFASSVRTDEELLHTLVSPGQVVFASMFSSVTDPDILAQLPPASRAQVAALNLTANGFAPSGDISCRTFAAGSAEILPYVLMPTQSELFISGGAAPVMTAVPLRLAEWPNIGSDFANPITLPPAWPRVLSVSRAAPRTAVLNATVTAHIAAAGWATQLTYDPNSVWVHYYSTWFSDLHWQVTALNATAGANGSMTLGPCGNMSVGETNMGSGQSFFAYNLLSELDLQGEYTLNLTSQTMYAWLPPLNASGHVIVGALSGAGDVLDVTNAQYLVFDGLFLQFARGAGVVMTNASGIIVRNCVISNVGIMAVNVTDGGNNTVAATTIRDTGNGGVYVYAGDRVTLTPANVSVVNSDITRVNRYTGCYVPSVALNGVGNAVTDSSMYNHPHSAVFISGNNHIVARNSMRHAVQWAGDSGVIYAGRDTTYRGNVVADNVLSDCQSLAWGVYSVYLDDYMSGWTVTGNTFFNTSCIFVGGGRDHSVTNNTFVATSSCQPVRIDARCSGNTSAQFPPILIQFLARVPYNTSAVWINSYPHLPDILQDDPCWPKYNAFVNNTFCGPPNAQFTSANNATLASWGSTEWDNVPVACPSPTPAPARAWSRR